MKMNSWNLGGRDRYSNYLSEGDFFSIYEINALLSVEALEKCFLKNYFLSNLTFDSFGWRVRLGGEITFFEQVSRPLL